jgi:magnesium transporter
VASMVRTRVWRDGKVHDEDFDIERVSDWIDEEGTFVWVDFTDPTSDDLRQIEDELGIHELAAEDAVERGQRPKLDRYRDNLFLVAYDVSCPASGGSSGSSGSSGSDVVTDEVKAFVTSRALVTMHGAGFDAAQFVDRWDANGDLAQYGVPYLVWGMLDVLVDHASATVAQIEDLIGTLEEDLFSDDAKTDTIQRRSFALRKSLGVTHRLVAPLREVVGPILRGDGTDVPDRMRPYFRDVADHVTNVVDATDQLRDAVSSILDTNLNLASNRQNDVMKKVTSWAAIIAIPTGVTSFFGMNVTFPGESSWSGLGASLVLIVGTSFVLYGVFKRRDWL